MKRNLVVSMAFATVIATAASTVAYGRGPWGPSPYEVKQQANGSWIVIKDGGNRAAIGGQYKSAQEAGAVAREANRQLMETNQGALQQRTR
ncbi:MAG: hypothetical protein R3E87_19660 [Burkholderiaceae bacterium]